MVVEYDIVTPNAFAGNDSERINQAVQAAAGSGRRVVIPRRNQAAGGEREVWLLDSAILLPSETTIELDHCHLKLSDRCRDNFFRSANCGLGIGHIEPLRQIHVYGTGPVLLEGADHPRATGDSAKTLGAQTFGTDAGVAGESQQGDWRNIGILLAEVEDFSLRGLCLKDSHCWAISLEQCAHGLLRDLDFDSTQHYVVEGQPRRILNQDGIDLRLGCHDILIENVTGRTGDDLIALTAIPNERSSAGSLGSTMVSDGRSRGEGRDDIRQVLIRNVRGYCHGGHHIVRLLNSSGAKLYEVVIDGLLDTSPPDVRCKAAVKIGDTVYGSGIAPLGDTARVIVNHVVSRAQHTILIGGSLCDSVLSNCIRGDAEGELVTLAAGPESISNVRFG